MTKWKEVAKWILIAGGAMALVEYEILKTGIATMDRFAIRGSVIFWSWVNATDPRYVMAIIKNESLGDPAKFVGDGGRSLGPGNIQFETWKAAGCGTDQAVWSSRNSPGHEFEGVHDVVRVWKWILATGAGTGSQPDVSTAFQIYNGGAGAVGSAATQQYAANALDTVTGFPG